MNRACSTSLLAVIIALLLLSADTIAQTQTSTNEIRYTPTVDSLLDVMKSQSGKELYLSYRVLHRALYEYNDVGTHLRFTRRFIEDAQKGNDLLNEAFARALKVEITYNYKMPDSVKLAEMQHAIDFMRNVPGAESFYYYTVYMMVETHVLAGNYEEALRVSEEMYGEAKKTNNVSGMSGALQSMAMAYEGLGMLDRAENAYREAISMAYERADAGMKSDSYSRLIKVLTSQERYDHALEVCREFEAFLKLRDNDPKIPQSESENLWFLNHLNYAATYIGLKQYALAEAYIERAESYPVAQTSLGIFSIEEARFYLLLAQRKYAEAERSLNLIDEAYGNTAGIVTKIDLKKKRADLYHQWGEYREAADLYKEFIVAKDSLQRAEMINNLNSLRARYEIDKITMEHQQEKRVFQTTLIWFGVALALLCVIIALMVFNARRLRAKNCSLLNRIDEQDKLEQENELLRNKLVQRKSIVPKDAPLPAAADEADDKLSDIYFRLKELMKNPAVFTKPDINRKSIAQQLGTNEKYIYDTIRKYYGMGISDYINSLRLNYARKLLSASSAKNTIESVATDAGFNSRGTFHRQFKERYGMTPDEFRKTVVEVKTVPGTHPSI